MKTNFKRKILKNGMTILFEKRNLPIVSVAFAVRNGGINESLEEKGISHFIEHMLYKGTLTRSAKKIAEEIERNGGSMNGFTSETMTSYWCKMPSEKIKIALGVLSDIVKNSVFDEKELSKERQVIFEEIKMRKDIPQIFVFDKIQERLYSGILALPIIGTYETMNSIDRKKIIEKFKKVYQPSNLILCVVGNADFEFLVDFCEKNFNNLKGEVSVQKFELRNEEKIEQRKGIDQANLVFAYHVPFGENKEKYSAKVLSALSAEGMSSRLFSEIREKRNLAYAIKGGSEITKYFGYNFIYVGAMKENVDKIKKIVLKEFEKISESLSEKELEEIKTQIVGQWKIEMEDSQSQMVNLLDFEIDGDAENFYDFEKNILAVKLGDVKRLAKRAVEEYSFFALVPED
ncbi:MAG: pitrilysin family protein [archaeon]